MKNAIFTTFENFCTLAGIDNLNIFDNPVKICKTIKLFSEDISVQKKLLTLLVCGFKAGNSGTRSFYHDSRKDLKAHNWIEKCPTLFSSCKKTFDFELLDSMDLAIIRWLELPENCYIIPIIDSIGVYNNFKINSSHAYYQLSSFLEYVFRLCLSNGNVNVLIPQPKSNLRRKEQAIAFDKIKNDPLDAFWDLGGNRKNALRSFYRTFKILNIDYTTILLNAQNYVGKHVQAYFDVIISSLDHIGRK